MQQFDLQKTREVGDILTDTFQYIRIHYKVLGQGLLYFVMPLYFIQTFLMQEYTSSIFSNLGQPDTINPLLDFFGWEYFLSLLLGILAYTMLPIIVLNHIKLTSQGHKPEVGDLIEDSLPLIMKVFALNIAIGIITIFSTFLFIIPGIFVAVKLSLAQTSLIVEDSDIGESISRSWDLTKGYWWATFGLIVFMYIISAVTAYVFIIPATLISAFVTDGGFLENPEGISTFFVVFSAISTAIGSLFTAVIVISLALQFHNLVERKEGGSLRSKIEGLTDL